MGWHLFPHQCPKRREGLWLCWKRAGPRPLLANAYLPWFQSKLGSRVGLGGGLTMASGNPASRRSHLRAECGWRPTVATAPDTALSAARPAS